MILLMLWNKQTALITITITSFCEGDEIMDIITCHVSSSDVVIQNTNTIFTETHHRKQPLGTPKR
jgi:6-phosphogluconate dehydrogenase